MSTEALTATLSGPKAFERIEYTFFSICLSSFFFTSILLAESSFSFSSIRSDNTLPLLSTTVTFSGFSLGTAWETRNIIAFTCSGVRSLPGHSLTTTEALGSSVSLTNILSLGSAMFTLAS